MGINRAAHVTCRALRSKAIHVHTSLEYPRSHFVLLCCLVSMMTSLPKLLVPPQHPLQLTPRTFRSAAEIFLHALHLALTCFFSSFFTFFATFFFSAFFTFLASFASILAFICLIAAFFLPFLFTFFAAFFSARATLLATLASARLPEPLDPASHSA